MTETTVTNVRTDLVSKVTVADVPGLGRVWLYVIAALPGGQAFGVTLGTYLGTAPTDTEMRFATGTVDPWAVTHGLDVMRTRYEAALDALTRFLGTAGLSAPPEETEASESDSGPSPDGLAEQLAEAKRQGIAEATERFEAWKRETNALAIDYANDNELCSVFDEFMESVGLEPRVRERDYSVEIQVTYRTTVGVTAESADDAAELVANNLLGYWSPQYDTPDDIEITDVEEE